MDRSDWSSRWSEGRIGFHQPRVSTFLERYAERAWGQRPGRILVPLAGKSLDMVFLAEREGEVVGVEYVEQAVREFFAERGLEPEVDPGPPVRFEAGEYTLFAADFFELGREDLGRLDAVFDRAALVALDRPERARYAARLRELLAPGAVILLITFEYEQAEMGGPPFSVGETEVREIFGDWFAIERLEEREVSHDRFSSLSWMREAAYVLARTGA